MKQAISDRRRRIQQKQRKIRILQKRLDEKRSAEIKRIFTTLIARFKPHLISDQPSQLSHESASVSAAISKQICEAKNPKGGLIDRIVGRIAERVASMVVDFLNFKDESKVARRSCEFTKGCFQIENFFTTVPAEEKDEEEIETISEDETTDELESQIEPSAEGNLTFLRKSQIQIDPEECENVFERLRRFQREKAAGESESSGDDEEISDEEDETSEEGIVAGGSRLIRKGKKSFKGAKASKGGKVNEKKRKGGKAAKESDNKAHKKDKTATKTDGKKKPPKSLKTRNNKNDDRGDLDCLGPNPLRQWEVEWNQKGN